MLALFNGTRDVAYDVYDVYNVYIYIYIYIYVSTGGRRVTFMTYITYTYIYTHIHTFLQVAGVTLLALSNGAGDVAVMLM